MRMFSRTDDQNTVILYKSPRLLWPAFYALLLMVSFLGTYQYFMEDGKTMDVKGIQQEAYEGANSNEEGRRRFLDLADMDRSKVLKNAKDRAKNLFIAARQRRLAKEGLSTKEGGEK